jgi:hypothetical protein
MKITRGVPDKQMDKLMKKSLATKLEKSLKKG